MNYRYGNDMCFNSGYPFTTTIPYFRCECGEGLGEESVAVALGLCRCGKPIPADWKKNLRKVVVYAGKVIESEPVA